MLNRKNIVATALIIVLIAASAYAIYALVILPGAGPRQGTISVVDIQGVTVTLQAPAKTVISLEGGLTELIYALGAGDKIVGRDQYSTFPSSVVDKPVVAEHSYHPPLEKILEIKPDLLLSNSNLIYDENQTRNTLEAAGIAVYVDESNDPETIETLVTNVGRLLGAEERAAKIVSFIQNYKNIVESRVKNLTENQKPKVYVELFDAWNTISEFETSTITYVGGINIAADQPIAYPIVSAEYIAEKNPDIMIRMRMVADSDMPTLQEQIKSRPALAGVNAVKNDKVYLYEPVIMQGVRYAAGLLYWAKWIHPELFQDIDPETVHREIYTQFFEATYEGVFAYP